MKTIQYDSKSLVDDCSFLLAANDKNTAKSVRVLITHGYRYCFTRSLAFAEDIASKQNKRTLVTKMFTELIMEEINTDKIQYNNLIRDTSSISMEETIRQTIVSIMESLTILSSPRPNIFCAPTQSGKTAFKALKILVYFILNVPVVVITKGLGESKELTMKIKKKYLSGYSNRIFSLSGTPKGAEHRKYYTSFVETFHQSSVFIIPDTYQSIQYTRILLTARLQPVIYGRRQDYPFSFALILDEADAILNRSASGVQWKEERELKELLALSPTVTKVTATPVPILWPYVLSVSAGSTGEEDSTIKLKQPIITKLCKPIDNYVGTQNMVNIDNLDVDSLDAGFSFQAFKPRYEFKTANECKVRKLCQSDQIVQQRKKFPNICSGKSPIIPKMNEQCIDLMQQEVTKKLPGLLILVDTNPRVSVGGIFHQAAGVQDYFFFAVENEKMIVIVVHADNIFYRLPGCAYGIRCNTKKTSLGELIDRMDTDLRCGLSLPIVVFGYNSMKRSRSFRSKYRVTSSMILCMGKGQSNENLHQAGGRATGKGKDILQKNRKTDKVLMLCPEDDFKVIQWYNPFVEDMIEYLNTSSSSNHPPFSSKHNFLKFSKRKTGNFTIKENHPRNQLITNTVKPTTTASVSASASASAPMATATTTMSIQRRSTIATTNRDDTSSASSSDGSNATRGNNNSVANIMNKTDFVAHCEFSRTNDRVDGKRDDDDERESNRNLYEASPLSMRPINTITGPKFSSTNKRNGALYRIRVPPGKLGISFSFPGMVVLKVNDSSKLIGKIKVGDKIVQLDDNDVRSLKEDEVVGLFHDTSDNPSRSFTILRTVKPTDRIDDTDENEIIEVSNDASGTTTINKPRRKRTCLSSKSNQKQKQKRKDHLPTTQDTATAIDSTTTNIIVIDDSDSDDAVNDLISYKIDYNNDGKEVVVIEDDD